MVQPVWKTVSKLLKKLKIHLPYDPAIPLLDTYPKRMKSVSQRNICTLMVTAAWFRQIGRYRYIDMASQVARWVQNLLAMQETQVMEI